MASYGALAGSKVIANFGEYGTEIIGDASTPLADNAWFEVSAVAAVSTLPGDGTVTFIFKTPEATEATPITPAIGDNVIPLTLNRICKTDLEYSAEEGTIDVTDDCGRGGFNKVILDGFVTISGTLNGFLKIGTDGTLQDITRENLGRFFNLVEDDSAGSYTVTERSNGKVILFILLNQDAEVDEFQNWLIITAYITTMSGGAALKDAQSTNMSFVKAEGEASAYQRLVGAGDLV